MESILAPLAFAALIAVQFTAVIAFSNWKRLGFDLASAPARQTAEELPRSLMPFAVA